MAEIGRDVAYPDAIGKMVGGQFVGTHITLDVPISDVIKLDRNPFVTIVGSRFRGPDLYATILQDAADARRRNWQADARTYIVHGGKLNASEVVRLAFGEEFDDRLNP